jgi:general secretion pathway protein K
MRIRSPRPWRERGVAVITALLLTTLAISIVASLFWQQQVQVRSMENQRLHLQTKWILRGALDWATLVLFQDGIDHRDYTSLDQVWATPLAETRLDQYVERERIEGENFAANLSGGITDACSRYNLLNLAKSRGVVDEPNVKIFTQLLRNLQLDSNLARRVAGFVSSGLPGGAAPPEGEQTQLVPVTGAPLKIMQVDDLLAVQGITPAIVERLRPFVTVLPERTPVNVNTAPAEVLAAVVPEMSVSEANTLIVRRKQAAWRGLNYFTEGLGGRMPVDGAADVKSDWFLVDSHIRLDRAALDAQALIQRAGNLLAGGGPKVRWIRQY